MAVKTPSGTVVTRKELRKALTRYRNGESKTSIERSFGVTNARGKWFSRAVSADLGIATGNSVLA